MGMPDTGYVYSEMQEDIFEDFPEILQILWREDGTSQPELRLTASHADKPYSGGTNCESKNASKDLQDVWVNIVGTLQSSMLRGWGESPNMTHIMDKNHVDCPAEEYPMCEE